GVVIIVEDLVIRSPGIVAQKLDPTARAACRSAGLIFDHDSFAATAASFDEACLNVGCGGGTECSAGVERNGSTVAGRYRLYFEFPRAIYRCVGNSLVVTPDFAAPIDRR